MDKQKSKLERKQKRFIKLLSKEKERRPEEIASTIDFDDPDVKKVVNKFLEGEQGKEISNLSFYSNFSKIYSLGLGLTMFLCWMDSGLCFGRGGIGMLAGSITAVLGTIAGAGTAFGVHELYNDIKEKQKFASETFDLLVDEVKLQKQEKSKKPEGRNL